MNFRNSALQDQYNREFTQCKIDYTKLILKNFYNDLIEHDIEKKEIKILMEKLNNVIFKNDLKS